MKRHHWITLGVVLLVAALLGGVLLRLNALGDGDEEGASTAADSARREVETTAASEAFAADIAVEAEGARVRRDTFVLWVTGEGEAAPVRSTSLHAEVGGAVLEVPAREGRWVAEGALLARVYPAEYRLAVEEARAAAEKARAQFRAMILHDEQIEDDSVRRERRELARVRSGLTEAEVRLEREKMNLSRTEIRAPFAGRVAGLAVSPGDRAREGDSLMAVLDLSRVDVQVQVLETELPAVEVGRAATARFTAFPNRTLEGRVVSVNPVVDRSRNTARVTVRLSNPDARVVPGMHARVRVAGRLHAGRTFVPREAVVERDRREVVFVFAPSEPGSATGRAKWRYVTTGLENEESVEIVPAEDTESLEPGEIVLVGGHTTLAHDARVRLSNADSVLAEGRR